VSERGAAATGSSLRVFFITWLGQLVSLVGSGLTSFAVGIKIYQDSGSVTQLSLVSFCYVAPLVLLSPVAGTLVDRWDRRRAMLLADAGAGSSALVMWALLSASAAGAIAIPSWVYLGPIAVTSAFDAFRWPAYQAATSLLVPKQHLGRANGLIELASGVGQVSAPALAAALVTRIGVQRVVLIDVVSFAFAIGSLFLVRFPAVPRSELGEKEAAGDRAQSLLQGSLVGWRFIRARPGLLVLLAFSVANNLSFGIMTVLITPFVLGVSDVATLGKVLSFAGLGMLLGGVTLSVWGGPRKRVRGIVAFTLLSGVVLFMGGAPPSVLLFASGSALFLFCGPLIGGCAQTIWQSKTPPDVQGRVFALKRMIAAGSAPLGNLIAGPLVDRLFEPWMAAGGALAGSAGAIIGTGRGRGIGLFFIVLGTTRILQAFVAILVPRFWNVEDDIPDALPDARDAKAPIAAGAELPE